VSVLLVQGVDAYSPARQMLHWLHRDALVCPWYVFSGHRMSSPATQ
jgi:hypothetical protein